MMIAYAVQHIVFSRCDSSKSNNGSSRSRSRSSSKKAAGAAAAAVAAVGTETASDQHLSSTMKHRLAPFRPHRSSGLLMLLVCFGTGWFMGSLNTHASVKQELLARITITHHGNHEALPLAAPNPQSSVLVQHRSNGPHTQSCWRCIKPGWRQHFIFANSSAGHLDACPDSSSWPAGTWSQNIKLSLDRSSSPGRSTGSQQEVGRQALPGEAAMLPGTLLAQQTLWRNQHPADCAAAKFIVYHAMQSGIGSVLHSEAAAMSAALETGRVFLEAPGHFLTATPYCGSNTTLDSCYFEPLSNCTLEMAGVTSQDLAAAPALTAATVKQFAASNPTAPRVVVMSHGEVVSLRTLVPSMFVKPLDKAELPGPRRYWWWRAQAIAYIVRPNTRSFAEIAARKQAKLRGRPLHEGCISLYVRHGDKGTEAKTWDDAAYEAATTQLRVIDSSLTRQLFVSTEDPKTVEYFHASARNWSTTVIDMKRKPDPGVSNLAYMAQHGYSEEMLDCLLNLDLSTSCDGFVASFYSNWARLIEELRATVRCKAHRVFFDVGGLELMHNARFGGLDLNW